MENIKRSLSGQNILKRLVQGAMAGLVAAVPMAIWMIAWRKALPKHEQYSLPPEQITQEVVKRAGLNDISHEKRKRRLVTWLSHLGYGAATGSLYPLVTGALKTRAWIKGLVFGLLVWGGSYLGWVPATGIMASATRTPLRRNVLMISSHLLWGSLIAFFEGKLEENP